VIAAMHGEGTLSWSMLAGAALGVPCLGVGIGHARGYPMRPAEQRDAVGAY
jgi:hypothetical protein